MRGLFQSSIYLIYNYILVNNITSKSIKNMKNIGNNDNL